MDFAGQKYSPHDDAPDVAAEFWIRIDQIKIPASLNFISRGSLF